MSWRIKWPRIDWLSIFGHNFARNDFAWMHPWVLISTESFLFLPFWLSSEQPAFGVAPTYLTLITNEPWLPGLRWTGHKKDELSRDFLICCGKSRWKKHAAALSSPQSQPKAQTAVASVKANAARRATVAARCGDCGDCGARLGMTAAAASRLIQFFSRKSGWDPLMRSPRENARQHDGLNWSVFEFYLDDVFFKYF